MPSDYFSVRLFKGKCFYVNKPQILQELKDNNRAKTEEITPVTIQNVKENTMKRFNACMNLNGNMIDIIF